MCGNKTFFLLIMCGLKILISVDFYIEKYKFSVPLYESERGFYTLRERYRRRFSNSRGLRKISGTTEK